MPFDCVLGRTANIRPTPYVYLSLYPLSGQENLLHWLQWQTNNNQKTNFVSPERDEYTKRIPTAQCKWFLRAIALSCYLHVFVIVPKNATTLHVGVDCQSSLWLTTLLKFLYQNTNWYAKWVHFAWEDDLFLAVIRIKSFSKWILVAETREEISQSEFVKDIFLFCIAMAFQRNVVCNIGVHCCLTGFSFVQLLFVVAGIILNNPITTQTCVEQVNKQSQYTIMVQTVLFLYLSIENEIQAVLGAIELKGISRYRSISIQAFLGYFCSFHAISSSLSSLYILVKSQNEPNYAQEILYLEHLPKTLSAFHIQQTLRYTSTFIQNKDTNSVFVLNKLSWIYCLLLVSVFIFKTENQKELLNSNKKEIFGLSNHFTRVNGGTSIERMVLMNCRINLPYLRDSMWLVYSPSVPLKSLYGESVIHYGDHSLFPLSTRNRQNPVMHNPHTDIQIGVKRLIESGQCNTVVFKNTFDGTQLVGNSQECLKLQKEPKHKHTVSLAATSFCDLVVRSENTLIKKSRSFMLLRVEIQAISLNKKYRQNVEISLNSNMLLNLLCSSARRGEIILNNSSDELFKIIWTCEPERRTHTYCQILIKYMRGIFEIILNNFSRKNYEVILLINNNINKYI